MKDTSLRHPFLIIHHSLLIPYSSLALLFTFNVSLFTS